MSIYNTSQGFIKPNKERINIQATINGNVIFKQLANNKKVSKGDTLLIVDNILVKQRIKTIEYKISETVSFVQDIEVLIKNKNVSKKLQSLKFKQEFLTYQQKLRELQTRFKKLKKDYIRNTSLYKKGVIAKVELDNTKLEYDLSLNAISQFKKQQSSTWQAQLVDYKNKLQELQNTQIQLEESNALSIIKAPISGTLLTIKGRGIEIGSFINTGLQLAEISPDADLLVECYITPTDIGLLRKGSKVNFQITAFNYNQWGLATGKITDIANDVQIIDDIPVFKILCSLDQEYLQLKNGFKGYLKKGMTLNARFELAERTLFDLLYDKMDDWLNPSNSTSI